LADSNVNPGNHEKSGSCAIVVLIVEQNCYVANVGDSRAIMSAEEGKKLYVLSRDHRPNEDTEKSRIVENGGKIYQT
jgi:protein phosphatase 2C family protein 2/3